METMKKRATIYKVFYDEEVINQCPQYEIVFSERNPYPYYDRLANYTAKDSSTKYIRRVIESVMKYLRANLDEIDGLFLKLDIEAVIVSAVLTRLKRNAKVAVKCPSYESVFLCNHKYYQRTYERHPIQFSYIDIDNDDVDWFKWKGMLNFPFFLKAPELQMSVHQYVIEDDQQLKDIVSQLRMDLPKYNADTKYVNEYALDLCKYPLASRNLMVCEELVSDCLQLNWEGWADHQGRIFTYGFTDEILSDYGIFSDFIMPSILPTTILKKAAHICQEFLRDISFKSSFANIELWIQKSNPDNIRIIEVNPRSSFSYHNQYRSSYHGANLYHSIIELSMGHTNIGVIPNVQTNFTGLYSCQSVFATRYNGRISQLLDFDRIEEEMQLKKDYQFFFLFKDRQFEIVDNHQSGARVLMRVFFTTTTYEQAQQESLRLKKLFLIKDDYYMTS